MTILLIGTILIIVALGLILHFQNIADITLNLFFWTFHLPIGAVAMGAFVLGILVAIVFLLPKILNSNLKNKKLEIENASLKSRLDDSGILFESSGLGTEGENYRHN